MPWLRRSTHDREIERLHEHYDKQLAQQRFTYEQQIETLQNLVQDLSARQERFDERLLDRLPSAYQPAPQDDRPQRILTDPAGTGLVVSYEDDDDPYATDEEPE